MNRRSFMQLSALAAGSLALPASFAGAGSPERNGKIIVDSAVQSMSFRIRYSTEIVHPPKHGKQVNIWIPLPNSNQEQDITDLSIQSPVPFNIFEGREYGNRMIHIGPEDLKSGDKVAVTYQIQRRTTGTIADSGDDVKKHLVLTAREKWDEKIAGFADSVAAGEKDPVETGRKFYYALADYLTYDKEIPGCGQGISVWTFAQKRGRCDDFHALFRTMMIYRGIPVRWEQGISLSYPSKITTSGEFEGDCTGAHCWLRFYAGDGKWFPVDVSEGNKRKDLRDYFFGTLSPNRFKLSTGRDIVLSPRQAGDPLNNFPYAYMEADGIPAIYGHNYRNIIKYEVMNIGT